MTAFPGHQPESAIKGREKTKGKFPLFFQILFTGLIMPVLLAAVYAVFAGVRKIFRDFRLRFLLRVNPGLAVKIIYQNMRCVMANLGVTDYRWKTSGEFSLDVKAALLWAAENFFRLSRVFEEARYSAHNLPPFMINTAVTAYVSLKQNVHKRAPLRLKPALFLGTFSFYDSERFNYHPGEISEPS